MGGARPIRGTLKSQTPVEYIHKMTYVTKGIRSKKNAFIKRNKKEERSKYKALKEEARTDDDERREEEKNKLFGE